MSRTVMVAVIAALSIVGAAQADVLNISLATQGANYNNMVRDAKLRGDGGLEDWNIGAGLDGSNRFYSNFLLDGVTPSGRLNNFLQWFDVSSIPAGSIINSATLTTYLANQSANNRVFENVKLSRLQPGKAWVETYQTPPGTDGPHYDGSVTWNRQMSYATDPPGIPWASPGALGAADIDLGTTQTFNVVGVDGSATTVVRDITSWVQAWVNTPASNTGILWWGGNNADSSSNNRYFWFGTKEDGAGPASESVAAAPMLVIDYTPGGTPVAPIIAEVTPDPDSVFAVQQYTKQLTLTQGTAPITWSVLPGAPAGTVVSGGGLVSGWTPGVSDIGTTFTIQVKAENAAGNDTESWQVTVQGVPPVIAAVTPDPEDVSGGTPYTKQLNLTQGTLPVTWSKLQGPASALIDSNGLVSGWTPTFSDIGQTFTFEIQAQNPYGTVTETWQVNVLQTSNGFPIDYVFTLRDAGQGGQLRLHRKSDGTAVRDFLPDGTNWETLTFAGTGSNDARLFTAKVVGDDIQIAEFNAEATQINLANLSTIIGGPVGTAPYMGNIRYSPVSNSLFIGLNPTPAATGSAVAYEIDLGLATRLHTYIGPICPSDDPRQVGVAVNTRDGSLYMISRGLDGTAHQGDLVVFSTAGRPVGGTTSTYTTLIDGPTYAVANSQYIDPNTIIYRRRVGGGSEDTVLTCPNPGAGAVPALEFWLDTTAHPSGNPSYLALRGTPINLPRGWNGQQDIATGDVWVAALRGGFHVIRADDTPESFDGTRNWSDAAVPPFSPCNKPPADQDADGDVDHADFAVFQVCFGLAATPPDTLPQACACLDLGDDNDDGIPDQDRDIDGFDRTAFEACASGPGLPADPTCGG